MVTPLAHYYLRTNATELLRAVTTNSYDSGTWPRLIQREETLAALQIQPQLRQHSIHIVFIP